jgi:hypothetical protein
VILVTTLISRITECFWTRLAPVFGRRFGTHNGDALAIKIVVLSMTIGPGSEVGRSPPLGLGLMCHGNSIVPPKIGRVLVVCRHGNSIVPAKSIQVLVIEGHGDSIVRMVVKGCLRSK